MVAGEDYSSFVFSGLKALTLLWSLSQGSFRRCAAAEVILAAPQNAGSGQDPSLHKTCPVQLHSKQTGQRKTQLRFPNSVPLQ